MTPPRIWADFAGCAAMVAAFAGAFLVMGLVPMPLFWYHPLAHRFALELPPRELAMDFYGRTLYASLAAALAFFAARGLGRKLKSLDRDRAWLWLAYGLGLVALSMSLIAFQLWPRPPNPVPRPAWYQPR